ncbi:hypothetical protein QVG61_01865 [Thiohalobacter sp. IOR34]|uniref:hypothetical protein n=1 Tax=Thiohalobacter sp. IOR34 TaxID=3057176 RepID=UPI0025B1523A|nr:hypothetical protein [Thiohalobacter sp. IOR34]WJW75859.1 hypothetical protein QVG61_01865 [Thiohalobacter sp. IOR34]
MGTRIGDMPVYATRREEVDATLYNLWRRARLHRLLPLRVAYPGRSQIVLIVEEDDWVVVDQNQYDLPLLAWTDFEDAGRSSLHTPVGCTLNYYHYMASSLRERMLAMIRDELEARLG